MGRSSRSRRSPCPYKLLGSTPQHEVGGSQATPNQSRRHHPPKGNRLDSDDKLLALVLQDDRLLNTQSLSHRFGLVEGIDWVERNLGRLEIKIHMVGVDDLDLNRRVGGSLSEIWIWEVGNCSECFSFDWDVVEGYI